VTVSAVGDFEMRIYHIINNLNMKNETLQTTETPMADDRVLTAGNFKPILFSTPMVQAILRGEKTQTRRIINPQPIEDFDSGYVFDGKHKSLYKNDSTHEDWRVQFILDWRKYKIGDILWVRETFQIIPPNMVFYKADTENKSTGNWKPSIFMPKEACRIFLKLTNIRIERLMSISVNDAISEGIESRLFQLPDDTETTGYKIYGVKNSWDENPVISYWSLWDSINGKKSYELNPFVWVYEFERTDASFACS
jgi:hypothetical protein